MPNCFAFPTLAACGLTLLLLPAVQAQQMSADAATNAPAAVPQVDPSSHAMAVAIGKMNANDVNGALDKLTEAIKLNPKNSAAYVLRASIYCQKKLWTQAEEDFAAAGAIDPRNVVIKFNEVEVKFLQKQYDAARPGYAALADDPDMGDLAKYKVFLCDLFGGHEDAAAKELDAFNKAGENASYYFSNAAWDLYHKKIEDARGWLISASHIYAPQKNGYYAQSLRDLGYLPLPEPPPSN
jgi:tetratricopeptide (TPR) repeat protein